MYKVLGDDGKEYGPATADQILTWKREGRVDHETRVCREGETEWTTLDAIPELSGRDHGTAPPPLPGDDGEPPALPFVPLDPLGCFEQAWQLFKAHAPLLMATCTIVALVQALMLLSNATSFIFAFLLAGPLYGGLSLLVLRTIRGRPAKIADIFSGFRQNTKSLVLASSARACLELAATVPLIMQSQNLREFPPYFLAICILAGCYVSLAYAFTFPLIADRGLTFWEGMEASRRLTMAQPFRVFLLMLVMGLVVLLGLLCFIAGVFVALPVAMAAYAFAYEQLTRTAE